MKGQDIPGSSRINVENVTSPLFHLINSKSMTESIQKSGLMVADIVTKSLVILELEPVTKGHDTWGSKLTNVENVGNPSFLLVI